LNVSANVKIAMQCFENFGGGECPPWLRAWFPVIYCAFSTLLSVLPLRDAITRVWWFYCSPVRVAIRPDVRLLLVGWNVGVVFKVLQKLSKDFYYWLPNITEIVPL